MRITFRFVKHSLAFLLIANCWLITALAQDAPYSLPKGPQAPVRAAAPNSPLRDQVVTQVLGPSERLNLHDLNSEASSGSVTDFRFLPNGDMLVADGPAGRVWRIGGDGILRVFAGNGSMVHSGDGGLALNAGFYWISALAISPNGVVYIGQSDGRIRRVDPDGKIRTVLGTGERGCPVPGAQATTSDADSSTAIAVDADEQLYFAPATCGVIYRVGTDGLVERVAGRLSGEGTAPAPVASKALPANAASYSNVRDLQVDTFGNLIFTAMVSSERRMIRVSADGVAQITPNGTVNVSLREGPVETLRMPNIRSVAETTTGEVWIGSTTNTVEASSGYELGVVDRAGDYHILFTRDGFQGKPTAKFGDVYIAPGSVQLDPLDRVYVRDYFTSTILRLEENGSWTRVYGEFGDGPGVELGSKPTMRLRDVYLASDAQGNTYIASNQIQKIFRLSPDGELSLYAGNGQSGLSGDGGQAVGAALSFDRNLAMDGAGSLYFQALSPATGGYVIRRIRTDGVIETVLGGGNVEFTQEGIPANSARIAIQNWSWALAPNGEIYFTQDTWYLGNQTIWKRGLDGTLSLVLGSLSLGQINPAIDGLPAKGLRVQRLDKVTVDPSGVLYFGLASLSEGGIYRVDDAGIVRAVVKPNSNFTPVDGMSTVNAPLLVTNAMKSHAPGRLLVSVNGYLAEYADGGTVTVWQDPQEGEYRNDGATVMSVRPSISSEFALLPGGGVMWLSKSGGYVTLRRSFPAPPGCTYSLSESEVAVPAGSLDFNVNLTTSAECPYAVGSSSRWIEIRSRAWGKGNATLDFRVRPNPSREAREGFITISGKRVIVKQAGNASSTQFIVRPLSALLPTGGGQVQLQIQAAAGVPWQVTLPNAWVSAAGPLNGTGNGNLTLNVAAHAGNADRISEIKVNAATVRLSQVAAAMMVPVTINTNSNGSQVYVDFQALSTPHVAQWRVGSKHHLLVEEWQKLNDNTLRKFEGWETGAPVSERWFHTPAAAANVTAKFGLFHSVRTFPTSSNAVEGNVALNYWGVEVPQYLHDGVAESYSIRGWYREGSTVRALAIQGAMGSFTGFTTPVTTTQNPVSLSVTGPLSITAQFGGPDAPRDTLSLHIAPQWLFAGEAHTVNPIPSPVYVPIDISKAKNLSTFVHYTSYGAEAPDWLTTRFSGTSTPTVVEFGVNTAKIVPGTGSSNAIVYFHGAGAITEGVHASFNTVPASSEAKPRITAMTDGGGFRQISALGGSDRTTAAAPGMIVSIFGDRLGTTSVTAKSIPLPTELGGTRVEVFDPSSSQWVRARLFYVSPGQVNFEFPRIPLPWSDLALNVRVVNVLGESTPASLLFRRTAPSVFTANSSGLGAPAGFSILVKANDVQQRGDLYACNNSICSVKPASLGSEGDKLFLELYGTGFDEATADNVRVFIGSRLLPVAFVGKHSQFVGLTQLNVEVPREIARNTDLDLYVWVRPRADGAWETANRVTVRFE